MNFFTNESPDVPTQTWWAEQHIEGFHSYTFWAEHFDTNPRMLFQIRKKELTWSKHYEERWQNEISLTAGAQDTIRKILAKSKPASEQVVKQTSQAVETIVIPFSELEQRHGIQRSTYDRIAKNTIYHDLFARVRPNDISSTRWVREDRLNDFLKYAKNIREITTKRVIAKKAKRRG